VKFEVPAGHYLVCYDYGMGGLWWFIKAESADAIRHASPELSVFEEVPSWMLDQHWSHIEKDDLASPKSEALRMILADEE
jgi:hypothetical protein